LLAFSGKYRILFRVKARAIMATTIKSALSTRNKEVYKKLSEALGDQLKQNVVLAPYTTFGIGGKADLFYLAKNPKELIYAIGTVQKFKLRFFVLGGGSNILVSDSGFRGLVIKNQNHMMVLNKNTITCQSGVSLSEVVELAGDRSLSGLEFAAGIPGTVGGAVWGNAGAFGKSMADVLISAVILTRKGEIKEVDGSYFHFAYRESILKRSGDILLSATFKLKKQDREVIEKKVRRNLQKREVRLPLEAKSAGCFFKNVMATDRKISAGFLLDQIGAKNIKEGDAKVSNQHANILINSGSAKAKDVKKLARKLKKKVKEKFNIELQEEVVYIN